MSEANLPTDIETLRDYAVLDGERLQALWAELDRLETERDRWHSVAGTRNVNIALIAEERDRLRNALLDARSWILDNGHDANMAPAVEGIDRALGCFRPSTHDVPAHPPQHGSVVLLHCQCGARAETPASNGFASTAGLAGWYFSMETGWRCPKCAPAVTRK